MIDINNTPYWPVINYQAESPLWGYLPPEDRISLKKMDPTFWNEPRPFLVPPPRCFLLWLLNTSAGSISDIKLVQSPHGKNFAGPHRNSLPPPIIACKGLPAGTKLQPTDIATPSGEVLRQNGLFTPFALYCFMPTGLAGDYGAISFTLDSFYDKPEITAGFALFTTRTSKNPAGCNLELEQSSDTAGIANTMSSSGATVSSGKQLSENDWTVTAEINQFNPYMMMVITAGS